MSGDRRGAKDVTPVRGLKSHRRAAGELEAAVLDVLWQSERPLRPGEVRDLLTASSPEDAAELSYSTVVTILGRLHEKGTLDREREGRAFRYSPVADEAGMAARRLTALLDGTPDRAAVLSRFVEDLSDRDEELLRDLLDDGHQGEREKD
jgi:predicted transcriptional regulator